MNSWGDAIIFGVTTGVLVLWATYIIVWAVTEEIATRKAVKAAKRRSALCDNISNVYEEWEAKRMWEAACKRTLAECYDKKEFPKVKVHNHKPNYKPKKRRGK